MHICRGIRRDYSRLLREQSVRQSNPLLRRSYSSLVTEGRPDKLSSEFKELEQVASRILQAKANETPGWRKGTRRLAEERRLKDALRDRSPNAGASSAHTRFTASDARYRNLDEVIEGPGVERDLEPGSFVEVHWTGRVIHGVLLTMSTDARQQPCAMVLQTSGEVAAMDLQEITFVIPGFIDYLLLRRCGTEAITTDRSAIAARLKVLKKSREFERAVEAAFNSVGRKVLTLYSQVRSPNRDGWAKLTTSQAARLLDARPNAPILINFAVHKHLMARPIEFSADSNLHRHTHAFSVRPQSHIDDFEAVIEWIRSNDTTLNAFVAKAQQIIDKSRLLTASSANEMPSKADIELPSFSKTDKAILRFVRRSCRPYQNVQEDPYAPFVPYIIKRLCRYDGTVDSAVVHQFMYEIGVFTPWEDVFSKPGTLPFLDHVKNLSISDSGSSDRMSIHASSAIPETLPSSPIRLTPDVRNSEDALDSVRRDFGDMPVYVIDDSYAEELDDGISFQAIPNRPEEFWVHVHIADPTAVISPKHPLAQRARRQMETIYLVHETLPMVPPSVRSVGLRQSSSDSEGEGQKVLTFSFKVDARGDTIDHAIQPAIVRNVHTVDYNSVSAILGRSPIDFSMPFEPSGTRSLRSSMSSVHKITPIHKANLQTLWDITCRLRAVRSQRSFLLWHKEKAVLSMSPRPPPKIPLKITSPHLYRGFPDLKYEVEVVPDYGASSRHMVAECMIAACRVASRFCQDKGLPILRRAAGFPRMDNMPGYDTLLTQRRSLNQVDLAAILRTGFKAPPTVFTLESKGHWSLGIPDGEGYVRVTSPLRRFSDMLAHWQIKQSFLPSSHRQKPLFSEDDLKEIALETWTVENAKRSLMNKHNRYWSHLYIHRWMQKRQKLRADAEGDPLECIKALTLSPVQVESTAQRRFVLLHLCDLGVSARLYVGTDTEYLPGTALTVRVKDVQMGLSPIIIAELLGGDMAGLQDNIGFGHEREVLI